MRTPDDIRWEFEQRLADERERHANTIEQIERNRDREIEKGEEFGGFIDRYEIAEFLGVSMPRVSVLINTGRFRTCEFGLSLADVERYKATRKAGRPTYQERQARLRKH